MVEIPKSLRSVFNAGVRERDGTYVLEIPESEIEHQTLAVGETYRVALLDSADSATSDEERTRSRSRPGTDTDGDEPPEPPVEEGEVREVSIETVGDQGDGIAKVERGYVVIVPGARPGDEPTVEIETVKRNVGFATVVDDVQRPSR